MPAATTTEHIVFFVAKLQEAYPVPLGCLDPVFGLYISAYILLLGNLSKLKCFTQY